MAGPRLQSLMKKGHFPVRLSLGLGLSAAICFFILGTFYFLWSLTFDLKDVGKIPERSLVYDMDGKVYSRLFGENRILADKVSPLFTKALLAREADRVVVIGPPAARDSYLNPRLIVHAATATGCDVCW